jgi:hypothetical protein
MNQQHNASSSDSADQSFFDFWQDWKPFFNVPQLGLTRYYQEHINQSVDKCYQMQGTMAQFASLLFQPIEKSFWDTQNGLFSSGNLKDMDAKKEKEIYANWIATLEKQYMELYRSPEFVQCFNKTMESLYEFVISHRSVLEDLLQMLPVPTHRDMDGLYKEFYELKKRVRDLEKTRV